MHVAHSRSIRPTACDRATADLLSAVSTDNLLAYVNRIAFSRHYVAERSANIRARDLLVQTLTSFGYTPTLQGEYDNIIATNGSADGGPFLLLGAHYDSVPGCPGADDNASAVAVCLECARLCKLHHIDRTMIVLFNREEDGLLGSRDFVQHLSTQAWKIEESHIFEMVGYCNRAPGSQKMPAGLPGVKAPDVGDFLALISNRHSNAIAQDLLTLASTYIADFPVIALKTYFSIERWFGHLLRSDHAPFWEAGISSVMWTDTSEFRNPHYHRTSDTPETLDYAFMANVARLALARAVART
jgi:Zn-dependent M28 family amino/carboxypeptidase